ncbi:hypothetical protein ACJX0J_019763, partial [Zea mays]
MLIFYGTSKNVGDILGFGAASKWTRIAQILKISDKSLQIHMPFIFSIFLCCGHSSMFLCAVQLPNALTVKISITLVDKDLYARYCLFSGILFIFTFASFIVAYSHMHLQAGDS